MADTDALGLREEVAEAAYTAIEWSGCAGSMWSCVPVSHRRKWYDIADALLPLIERREAEAAERALRELQWRLNTAATRLSGLIDDGTGYGERRLQGKREGVLLAESYAAEMLRADHIGGTQ